MRPREFTRLDEIVELLFSTAEDIKQEQVVEDEAPDEDEVEEADLATVDRKPKFVPVAFHDACIRRIEKVLGTSLKDPIVSLSLRPTKTWTNMPSTWYRALWHRSLVRQFLASMFEVELHPYWFAFHPHQAEYLFR